MNKQKFYNALRESGAVFGATLSQAQVDGCDAILDSCARQKVTAPHYVANILAQVAHETGGYMLPIKETVMPHHKDKNPSDATVIKRLDRAFAKGQLSWVKTPYWRDGAFGRGPIQTTHWRNYETIGRRLGLPLRNKPELLLNPKHGADSAVIGMMEGLYTGKKLSDYRFPGALDSDWRHHPRRIVNGNDGTDAKISKYHRAFYGALVAAGRDDEPIPKRKPSLPETGVPPGPPDVETYSRPAPDRSQTKPLAKSTTMWSAVGSALTGGASAIAAFEPWVAALVVVIIAGFAFWIMKERLKRHREQGG